jgi:predicted TIM-barrel fold metal-dependent hydrolase
MANVPISIPAGACDCHTHIFGNYPLVPERRYTPEAAGPEAMAALHRSLGIERVVIVTPSVYGTDNASTLDGIKARGATARGIAVVSDQAGEAELKRLHAGGIRGIRLNLATAGVGDPVVAAARLRWAAEQVGGLGWHVQVYTTPAVIAALAGVVAGLGVPVVFDHFGGARAELGVKQTGFAELVKLVGAGRAYVKISGAYHVSKRGPNYPDCAPMAQALLAANAERVVWGTDWPHPQPASGKPLRPTPFQAINDGLLLQQLGSWAPDASVREKILVTNPARLYGF